VTTRCSSALRFDPWQPDPPLPCPSARSIALHHEASRDPHRDASNFGVVTST
jgi:hypothetical protein